MSEREYREKLAKEVTNDVLTDKFIQDVGQKAIVERTEVEGEHMDQLRAVLADIGQDLLRAGAAPKGMQYLGSLSVHVFASEILNQVCFVTLNNAKNLHFAVADAACREMNQKIKEWAGLKRQKLRSGF